MSFLSDRISALQSLIESPTVAAFEKEPAVKQLADARAATGSKLDPLAAYLFSDKDEAANPFYYGLLRPDGAWVLNKVDNTAGTSRYAVGTTGYPAAWAARTTQTYSYASAVVF